MADQLTNSLKARYPGYDDEYARNEIDKSYTHLIAAPGRVAQAREITQIQSTVKNIIKSVGDSFMKDGDIIEGCLPQKAVRYDNEGNVIAGNWYVISAGKVYMNGMVLPVGETWVEIEGKGTEKIGFILEEYLVDASDDPNLRDPAQNFDNYNQPGCYRVQSIVKVKKSSGDDESLREIVTLIDGSISVKKNAPTYSELSKTLARRTEDESGSYIVNGLKISTKSSTDPNYYIVEVATGKAYVRGYELDIPNPREIKVARALSSTSINPISKQFDNSTLKNELSKNNPHLASIDYVHGMIEGTTSFTKSYAAGDTITVYTHPYDRSRVSTESNTIVRVYTDKDNPEGSLKSRDIDYELDLTNGDILAIKWIGTGSPSNLHVDYVCRVEFEKGVDYKFYVELDDRGDLIQGVEWLSGGKHPNHLSVFTAVCFRYLARKDIVCISETGEISVVKGIEAISGYEVLPEAKSNTLVLAYITNTPNGGSDGTEYEEYILGDKERVKSAIRRLTKIYTSNVGLSRFTMRDIQRLLNRVKKIEYDQTILSLNDTAKSAGASKDMRGIYTDPMVDYSRVHYGFTDSLEGNEFRYDVVLDTASNLCYLPIYNNIVDAVYESGGNRYSQTASLEVESQDQIVISQFSATDGFKVNPYTLFPQAPELSLDPPEDSWYDVSIVEVQKNQVQGSEVVEVSVNNTERNNTSGSRRPDTIIDNGSTYTNIGVRVDSILEGGIIDSKVGDAITYIRPRTITVTGSLFPANLPHIKGYFDGVLVPLTIVDGIGTQEEGGAVKADDRGRFQATFQIPEKVTTGIKEFRVEASLSSKELLDYDGQITYASAIYSAFGYYRTDYKLVTVLTTILQRRVDNITTIHNIDPVAQTFVLNQMTLLSGVNLYFKKKPEDGIDTPVICEIREVVNGNITATSYGSKSLLASEVIPSDDASIATKFRFNDPILLEANTEYAIVVKSNSPSYEIWIAELGNNDISTGYPVVSNPYLVGVMMSSSNNSSWTVHQTKDIKFDLLEDTYKQNSTITFEDISLPVDTDGGVDFSRVYLVADSIIPSGTSIDWEYQVDNSNNWQPIYTDDMTLLGNIYSTLKIRAKMSRDEGVTISPIIPLATVGTSLSKYKNEGYYVTESIQNLDKYNNVDIIIDDYLPSTDTSIEVYVSTGTSGSWYPTDIIDRETKTLDYGWYEHTYRTRLSDKINNDLTDDDTATCRILVKLDSTKEYTTPAFRRLRVIMSYEE